jgi:hypothetical protein
VAQLTEEERAARAQARAAQLAADMEAAQARLAAFIVLPPELLDELAPLLRPEAQR